MPEEPAKKIFGFTWGSPEKIEERLATPEELAEYGALAPDPQTEEKILALFEEQLVQDLVRKTGPGQPAVAAPENDSEAAEQVAPAPAVPEAKAAELVIEATPQVGANAPLEEAGEEEVPAAAQPLPDVQSPVLPELMTEEQTLPDSADTADDLTSLTEIDLVPTSQATASDLLEVAEVLDQHRLWVESGGKEGTQGDLSGANLSGVDLTGTNLQGAQMQKANLYGADLSMANLRNANLVEADLRETNLLGTEFSGANLMGANLYDAQGLWAGRLGGTNLFDAALPEAVATLSGSRTIAQFTQSARWFYLLLMTLCVGAGAVIAMTTDVRLLLDQSAWRTARIPNLLPLQGFYLGAPLLLTVLYLRLQFLLLRLWGSMGALPAVFPDGQTPEKDGRWYLMGPIRPHLKWARDPRSPLGMAECYVAMVLAYWTVPTTLFFFWLRYLVLQDYRGTLLHVFLFTVASAAACGMPRIVKRVLRPGDWTEESTPQFLQDVLKALRVPVVAGAALFLLSLGVIRGLPADPRLRPEVGKGDPRRWAATIFQAVGYRPYADVTDERISTVREKTGSGEESSNQATGPRLNEIDLRYARGYHAAFAGARMWRANLEGTSLAEADFRGANLRETNLRWARMDRVQVEKANLVSADAQDAVFSGGNFQNSDLSFANLEGATLTTANLQRATLYSVNLRFANLLRADLSHADLRDTKLEQAVLSLATLEQTDFSAAKMMGANLTGAQAKGTIFLEADLSRADLRGATFAGAVLRQVKLDGANVLGTDFRGALG
ncbi:MAG TPA: pentapeptide repeat-containing protein, partial [Candidatus Sulfotelmatobacter sp.]|nr:pentapeptide repeat-containing protein [Candidatus Sulfotelmatobacter sp.]